MSLRAQSFDETVLRVAFDVEELNCAVRGGRSESATVIIQLSVVL